MICVSFSGLNMYGNCPASFKYKYIDELEAPQPLRNEAPALYRGLDVHQSMEDYINGDDKLHEALERHRPFMDLLRAKKATAEQEFCFDRDWADVPFDDRVHGRIRGKLDAVFIEDDVATLVELKTGRRYDIHQQQLELYCLATLLLYPEISKVDGMVFYVDGGIRPIEISRARPMLLPMQHTWQRKMNACQPPQPYPVKPNWKCKFCPYSKRKEGPCEN